MTFFTAYERERPHSCLSSWPDARLCNATGQRYLLIERPAPTSDIAGPCGSENRDESASSRHLRNSRMVPGNAIVETDRARTKGCDLKQAPRHHDVLEEVDHLILVGEVDPGILYRRDGKFGFVDGGDAVADRNPLPVDEDHALGRGEIGMPQARRRRVDKGGPGKERRTQDPRVGADQECLGTLGISTCELDEASGAIFFGEFAAVPAGLPATMAWKQPDLKQLEGIFVGIMFGMADTRYGAHDLDIASNSSTDVAGTVFVRDRALAD